MRSRGGIGAIAIACLGAVLALTGCTSEPTGPESSSSPPRPAPEPTLTDAPTLLPITTCAERFMVWAEITFELDRDSSADPLVTGLLGTVPEPACSMGPRSDGTPGALLAYIVESGDALAGLVSNFTALVENSGLHLLSETHEAGSQRYNFGDAVRLEEPWNQVVVQAYFEGAGALRDIGFEYVDHVLIVTVVAH